MRSSLRLIAVVGAALVACIAARSAYADGHASAIMSVSANVIPNCQLTIDPLRFGTYDPLGANSGVGLDASTTLTVVCTLNSLATVVMDAGQNGTSNQDRFLAYGDYRLPYQIFLDSSRTRVWASGANALHYTSSGIRNPGHFTVYGHIPPGKEVAAGTYSDTVTATVDF